jgi:hypothetical protein
VRPDLPLGLMEVVRHAIAADRAQRLPSARALADALAPFRGIDAGGAAVVPHATDLGFAATRGEVKSTSPSSSVSAVTGQWARRRGPAPLAVAGGAIALAAAALGIALTRRAPPATAVQPSTSPAPSTAAMPASSSAVPEASASSTSVQSATEALTPLPEAGPTAVHKPSAAKEPSRPQAPPTSPSAAPPPSAARDLGLSQDNPFR